MEHLLYTTGAPLSHSLDSSKCTDAGSNKTTIPTVEPVSITTPPTPLIYISISIMSTIPLQWEIVVRTSIGRLAMFVQESMI